MTSPSPAFFPTLRRPREVAICFLLMKKPVYLGGQVSLLVHFLMEQLAFFTISQRKKDRPMHCLYQ